MSTYAYGTERADELLDSCAPVPSDWIGRYVDEPTMRKLPLNARPGLRTLDDRLRAGDTVCLWSLGDVWGTLQPAVRQLRAWHEKGVTVKLLGLSVTLGQNAPEMLRLLKGASWAPPLGPPPKVRPMPKPLVHYIGYGWITKWNAKQQGWFVAPCERTREIQGMILRMLDDMLPGQVATALNIGKLWVRGRKFKKQRGGTSRAIGATANTLKKWTATRIVIAAGRERELREFEHAYASDGLSESFGEVSIGRGWFAAPTGENKELCRLSRARSNRDGSDRRRGKRHATLAPATGLAGDTEAASGDDGADRARGPAEP